MIEMGLTETEKKIINSIEKNIQNEHIHLWNVEKQCKKVIKDTQVIIKNEDEKKQQLFLNTLSSVLRELVWDLEYYRDKTFWDRRFQEWLKETPILRIDVEPGTKVSKSSKEKV